MLEHLFNDFTLSQEVLKSRRNLIILSFSSIAFILLSPHISEIKITGIEIKFSDNKYLDILLLCAIAYELMTFILRLHVNISSEPLKELEQKRENIEKALDEISENVWNENAHESYSIEFATYKLELIDKIEKLKIAHNNQKRILCYEHITSEVLMPIVVASAASTFFIFKILKYFS